MKKIAHLLLAGGFLVGAYATALDVQNVSWELFVIAAVAALAIALITVIYQAVRAALSNPVMALRHE